MKELAPDRRRRRWRPSGLRGGRRQGPRRHRRARAEGPGRISDLNYRIESGACSFRTSEPWFSRKSLNLRGHRLCGRARFSMSFHTVPWLGSRSRHPPALPGHGQRPDLRLARRQRQPGALRQGQGPVGADLSISPAVDTTRPDDPAPEQARDAVSVADRGACGPEHGERRPGPRADPGRIGVQSTGGVAEGRDRTDAADAGDSRRIRRRRRRSTRRRTSGPG